MFSPNWSAKVEYMYYNLGGMATQNGGYTTRVWMPGTFANAIPYGQVVGLTQTRVSSSTIDGNIVRAGVNYHFNLANISSVLPKF
jgi:outer membrane immunogenic protein